MASKGRGDKAASRIVCCPWGDYHRYRRGCLREVEGRQPCSHVERLGVAGGRAARVVPIGA